jgi:ribosomal protein S18 acetylase RimI-like enzyme
MDIRSYENTDLDEVIKLWGFVFPNAPTHNDPISDIQSKLKIQHELFFVAVDAGKLIGTVAVHPEFRRRGIGSALMKKVEGALIELGCPKLNLQIRAGNSQVQSFYDSLGYSVEERISMGKRLSEIPGED